jgi:DNA-binding beta-propeller fold protein YncE
MAFDAAGNLHVTVRGTMPGHVLIYDPDGVLRGDWEIAGFPAGIAVDAQGNVYVSGGSDAPLQKFDQEGRLLMSWGGPNPPQAPGELDAPEGIAVDGERNVYVADTGNNRVQRFTDRGLFRAQWTGENLGLGPVFKPFDVAVGPQGDVAILDERRRIVLVSRDGHLLATWPVTEGAQCSSIAIDPEGRVYVAADVVRVFDAQGNPLHSWPSASAES